MATATVTGEILFVDPDRITLQEDCGKFKRRWTIWDQTGTKGDTITATGELGTGTRPWTGKDGVERIGVDHVLRKATIAPQTGAQTPVQAPPAEWDQQQWNTVAGDSDTPF